MGSQDGDFGYLHMLGCGCYIEADIGNVVAYQRFHAFIDIVGTLLVTTEPDNAEVGLYQSGLDVRHANSRFG